MTNKRYDVVIVGFGLSSGPVIQRLSQRSDLRILVVDRGECRDPASFNIADDYAALPRRQDHVLFASDAQQPVPVRRWWARDFAGGGSLTWYGQLSRFYEPDFALRTRATKQLRPDLAEIVDDWPIGESDLLPYYRRIEMILRPIGPPIAYSSGLSDCEHVVRRPALSVLETTLLSSLANSGLHPYIGATCLGGRAWEQAPVDPLTYERLIGCGLHHRSNWFAQALDAVNKSTSVEILERQDVQLVLHHRGHVSGVELRSVEDIDRPPLAIEARCVVMAAGPIDTISLLLRSGIQNSEGLLGNGFTYTTEVVCYMATKIPRSRQVEDQAIGTFSSVVLRDFYLGDGTRCIKGGKVAIYDALACESPGRHLRSAPFDDVLRSNVIARESEFYVLKLSFKGESIPWERKYVSVGCIGNKPEEVVPSIHYELHPHDLEVRAYAQTVFAQLARAIPGGQIVAIALPEGADLISGHQHGGVRFGTNEGNSLLDRYCESWSIAGLHIVDSSFMPTSGATNSSFTVLANSLRVAERLAHLL